MFSYIWRKREADAIPEHCRMYEATHELPLIWIEHCVECAAPLCYSTCGMFKPRSDGRCVRFDGGVLPYGHTGGQITFRRWAKLQTPLPERLECSPTARLKRISNLINSTGYALERIMHGVRWNRHRPAKVVESLGIMYLSRHTFKRGTCPADGFLACVYNHESEPLKGIIETMNDGRTLSKHAIDFAPGWNEKLIPIHLFDFGSGRRNTIHFYLEGDTVGTLTFDCLNFVTLKPQHDASTKTPAAKVKCVAWDLDNTLWDGVVGDGDINPYPQSLALVEKLDRMGVLQTIVSKNTHDVAWRKVEQLRLDHYFLYPAINWGRKSQNLIAIAHELNINIDTFALIDDSKFEREEVKTALPQVRVYDTAEIEELTSRPEFDIPVTEESARRRESYQKEIKRKAIRASYGNDYDSFLRDCDIRMEIFRPTTEAERTRCLELLQRSNQYNVSKQRRQADDFEALFAKPEFRLFAIRVGDRWGDYGIVGFVSIEKAGRKHLVRDFVMSCRVAQKKVERAFFNWYVGQMPADDRMNIDVWKTDRNAPLRDELKTLPLQVAEDDASHIRFCYIADGHPLTDDKIIKVSYSS